MCACACVYNTLYYVCVYLRVFVYVCVCEKLTISPSVCTCEIVIYFKYARNTYILNSSIKFDFEYNVMYI